MGLPGRDRAGALLWSLIFVIGCAGEGPFPATDTTLFDRVQQMVFDVHCLDSGCHNATDRANDLVLEAGLAHAALVGVVPVNSAAQAAGLLRIDPGLPDRSFLLTKLTGPGPGQGSRMPFGRAPLPQEDIELVRQWILAGAPDSDSSSQAAISGALAPRRPTATATATATMSPASPTPTLASESSLAELRAHGLARGPGAVVLR